MSVRRMSDRELSIRRIRRALLVAGFAAAVLAGCSSNGSRARIRIASTTSLYDTGLLDVLTEAFQDAHPAFEAQVMAVGTGEALELGRRRDADLVLAHAPDREAEFMSEGYGLRRTTFMRNDFVLAGPETDPAGVAQAADAADALRLIGAARAEFASRGDESGTHIRERRLWAEAGLESGGGSLDGRRNEWYVDLGQGMGATLLFAGERQAYVLTDRATLTTLQATGLELVELHADDASLVNLYSVISVAGAVEPEGAAAFEAWILGEEAAAIIRDYGVERYGRALFTLVAR